MKQYEISSRIKAEKIMVLLQKPMTMRELADAMFISYRGIVYWKDKLRDQIHIAEWRDHQTPAYMAGVKKDARKPAKMTRHQIYKRHIAKFRQDLDKYDARNARERARYYARKPKKLDPLVAALFGAQA